MFTGLIEEVGSVTAIGASKNGNQLKIAAPRIAKKIRRGDSLAVNGCCLTLNSRRGDELIFDLLEETVARTNLKSLQRKQPVNLERAVAASERDRKSTRLNSSHMSISYAVFCLKKKKNPLAAISDQKKKHKNDHT